jgi:hypothetical protein
MSPYKTKKKLQICQTLLNLDNFGALGADSELTDETQISKEKSIIAVNTCVNAFWYE